MLETGPNVRDHGWIAKLAQEVNHIPGDEPSVVCRPPHRLPNALRADLFQVLQINGSGRAVALGAEPVEQRSDERALATANQFRDLFLLLPAQTAHPVENRGREPGGGEAFLDLGKALVGPGSVGKQFQKFDDFWEIIGAQKKIEGMNEIAAHPLDMPPVRFLAENFEEEPPQVFLDPARIERSFQGLEIHGGRNRQAS